MSDKKLPKGWKWMKLEEVAEITSSKRIFRNEYVSNGIPFYRTKEIKELSEGKSLTFDLFISNEKYNEIKSRFTIPKKGDVLLSAVGTIGISYIIKDDKPFYFKDGNLMWLRNLNGIDSKYLSYGLTNFIKNSKNAKTSGSAYSALTIETIKNFNFPIASLETQQAIVDKIEELFSELDKGIEDLKTAQQQLKTYRQSVLKYAFEGKLTNENVKDGELPKGWEWSNVKEITTLLGDGLHGTPKYDSNGEYYFINGNNLNDGKIEIKENTKKVSKEEFEKYKKQLNDKTIFVSINGSLGYTAFYNNEPVILGKSACYFNVKDGIDKHYIRYIFTSQRFTNYSVTVATGSTIKNVSLKSMREFEIPLPKNIEEQCQIVQQIESRLSVADKMEESIAHSLLQAESLRQSILKKAFSGELV